MLTWFGWLFVTVTVACVVVRYALPVALTALVDPLCGMVGVVAALFVLPEFWISAAYRRDGGCPPALAYLYGEGVCRMARLGHRVIRHTLRSLASGAHTVPPPIVALTVAAWQVILILP
jgi:hypothetical protein